MLGKPELVCQRLDWVSCQTGPGESGAERAFGPHGSPYFSRAISHPTNVYAWTAFEWPSNGNLTSICPTHAFGTLAVLSPGSLPELPDAELFLGLVDPVHYKTQDQMRAPPRRSHSAKWRSRSY